MTETPVDPTAEQPAPDVQTTATVDELAVHNGEPDRPTATDDNGVTRIVGPPTEGWTPAQVDPTDEQIAHNQALHDAGVLTEPPDSAKATDPTSVDAGVADVAPPVETPAEPTDQEKLDAAAAADAEAQVAAQVAADQAAADAATAAADDAALAAAEAQTVTDQEGQT